MGSEDDIPEVYRDLLKRVENIEKSLSKSIDGSETTSASAASHAAEDRIEINDDDLADLHTEKVAPIVMKSSAYLKLAIHAKKYANSKIKKKHWVEVIGLLTGHIVNENTPIEQIVITEAWPIGHGDAVSVEILESKSFAQVMSQIEKGDFIVGWYHSHPSYGNFLSIDDYNTQNRYQRLWSKAIALVIDPTTITKSNFGFGVFRNTRKEPASKGYTELTYEMDGLTSAAANEILKLIRPAFEGENLKFLEYE